MTVPGRTTIFTAGILAMAMVLAVVEPTVCWAVVVGNALLVGVCLTHGQRLARTHVTVERDHWSRLEIDRATDLVFRVQNRSERTVFTRIRQPWPASFSADTDTLELRLQPGEVVLAALSVTAQQRGHVTIPPIELDVRLPTDFARHRRQLDEATVVSVYPNLRAVAQYDALRRHHALGQFGIHRTRMVGSGREFDQLRDYLRDDNYGDINWKASARRRQLVTNVYRAERSQDVLLCLDCGRMMGNPLGAGTALDRAVDASCMLTHVCSRWGDRVGLALFRDTVTRYVRPMSGGQSSKRIIEELIGASPEGVFPSYTELVTAIRANQKRRGMIFIFTDLNDPQLASNLTTVLPLISRRHVAVVISMRDPLLEAVASGPASDRRGVCQVLAARHLADERAARVRELVKAGVRVLEVNANSITIDAINAYMAIKMRQLV